MKHSTKSDHLKLNSIFFYFYKKKFKIFKRRQIWISKNLTQMTSPAGNRWNNFWEFDSFRRQRGQVGRQEPHPVTPKRDIGSSTASFYFDCVQHLHRPSLIRRRMKIDNFSPFQRPIPSTSPTGGTRLFGTRWPARRHRNHVSRHVRIRVANIWWMDPVHRIKATYVSKYRLALNGKSVNVHSHVTHSKSAPPSFNAVINGRPRTWRL